MLHAIAFYVLSFFILGFAVLVVSTRNTVHSVLYLVLNFLAVAALYVMLTAQFLAVIQVLVYAGGIVVLYLFVVMLVNLKRPPEDHSAPQRQGWIGFALAGVVLAELGGILILGRVAPQAGPNMELSDLAINNVERIGMLLYTDYLIPFELASMLLLVAMVGAIILAKRELNDSGFGIRRIMITPVHYQLLSAALFIIGVAGVMMRRNIIIIFMSIELILNAVNINLIAFSYQLQNGIGQVFAIFVIAVAAAEAAVGLGIILAFYRNKETINIDEMNVMRW